MGERRDTSIMPKSSRVIILSRFFFNVAATHKKYMAFLMPSKEMRAVTDTNTNKQLYLSKAADRGCISNINHLPFTWLIRVYWQTAIYQ